MFATSRFFSAAFLEGFACLLDLVDWLCARTRVLTKSHAFTVPSCCERLVPGSWNLPFEVVTVYWVTRSFRRAGSGGCAWLKLASSFQRPARSQLSPGHISKATARDDISVLQNAYLSSFISSQSLAGLILCSILCLCQLYSHVAPV